MQRGDRVAILALNSDRFFELLYAIPWLGAEVMGVNTRLATPEIRYVLENYGARVLFVDGAMRRACRCAGRTDADRRGVCSTLTTTRRRRAFRSYEELAAATAIADAGAGGDTLAGLGGTEQHQRQVQGSDAQPRHSDGERDERRSPGCNQRHRTRPTFIPARCSVF